VPKVKNTGWRRNPIDAFVAAGHEEQGVKPRPEAARAVLLRRVYLDLTGLPPTPDELHAFLDDTSADAYEKVVDKLLASPRYGERWGRHWMDVGRYSDWAGWGAQVRDSQPHIWHWRDWIVESLNADKGYDRKALVQAMRDYRVTPHFARKPTSIIDQRPTRHPGYAASQRKRKRVEEIFGWVKTVGGLRKTRHRGVARVDWIFSLALAAYNLVRMRNLALLPA